MWLSLKTHDFLLFCKIGNLPVFKIKLFFSKASYTVSRAFFFFERQSDHITEKEIKMLEMVPFC